jgi:small-conductance mechanosensitive channel
VPRLLIDLLLAAVTVLLWVATGFAQSHRVFAAGSLPTTLHIAATLATVALFVTVASQIVLRLGFARLFQTEPTELQRGLVVSALAFAAIAVALAYFGFDFSSILVFSALITAIIGLSVQPVLGSLISGLAAERVIGVGDGVLLGNESLEVTALRWRSVVARRADGSTVVLPNARLVENTMEIAPRDSAARAEARFDVSSGVPPHRLQRLIADLIVDFPDVDRSRPVRLIPVNIDRGQPYETVHGDDNTAARYRATFWVRHFLRRADAEGRLLRRLWYGLRREGLVPAGGEARLSPPVVSAALQQLDNQAALGFASLPGGADMLIEAGRALLYDDGECIALPAELDGQFCLLVEGRLADDLGSGHAGHGLSREASLARLKQLLASHIGPFAAYAVDQAARGDASLASICATVADEIEDESTRRAFLASADLPSEQTYGPGLLFRTRSDGGRVLSQRPLRAVDHALVLVAPDWAFRNELPQGAAATR